MNVCADLRWPDGTGIGVVRQEILARRPADIHVNALPLRTRIGAPGSALELSRCIARSAADVFWSPGFVPPLRSRIPYVVTVHDLTHLHFYSRFHAAFYRFVFRPAYRRATRVLCVSEFTRREFIDWSGIDESRVHVVHNGVSPAFQPRAESGGAGVRYVLYPGNRRSYKNLDRLVSAFGRSQLPGAGIELRLTGAPSERLLQIAREAGCAHRIRFLGTLDASKLVCAYQDAAAVAFVSLYEGFGLPILEAMACGVPVITSSVSAMPEVAGGAALLVDPRSIGEIVAALETAVLDEARRPELRAAGLRRVADFDWNDAARTTWQHVRMAGDS